MTDELIALLAGKEAGRIRRDRRGRPSLTYDHDWRAARDAYPFSLSMPLIVAEHGPEPSRRFCGGFFPTMSSCSIAGARRFRSPRAMRSRSSPTSARTAPAPFSSLRPIGGRRCSRATSEVDWLDENGVAERLRMLREDHAAWRGPRDTGQFSLAGAQPKTALLRETGGGAYPPGAPHHPHPQTAHARFRRSRRERAPVSRACARARAACRRLARCGV